MTGEPAKSFDVVVVGGGLGGLMSAALLAKAGLSVCVLEMDGRPGGYLVGFEREGYSLDTAILWLNQCGPGGSVRRALDLVGPGAPETPPLHDIRRYKGETFDYLLTDQPDKLRDQLIADFPHERAGLLSFFAAGRSTGLAFNGLKDFMRARETWTLGDYLRSIRAAPHGLKFLRNLGPTAEQGLKRYFKDERLLKIFCSEEKLIACLVPVGWAYLGDYQMPPVGGSKALPRFLCDAVRSLGGEVRLRSKVSDILLEGRRAVGVRYTDADGAATELRSRWVVAACDLESIYEHALPAGTIDPKVIARLKAADLYASSVSVWLGLDRPAQELGFGEELTFLTRDDIARGAHNSSDPATTAINLVAPSTRDPSLTPKGKGLLSLNVAADFGYGETWQTEPGFRRGEAYRKFKHDYTDVLIDRVAKALCPNLREHIELCEAATPITHWRYTGNRLGSIMGATPVRKNIRADVAHYRTPVDRLILGGQWAEYGGGVPVAVRAGSNSALIILRKERPAAFEVMREVLDGRLAATEAPAYGLLPLPQRA